MAWLIKCVMERGKLRRGGQLVVQEKVEKFEIRGVSSEGGDGIATVTEDTLSALDLGYRGFAGEGVSEAGVVTGVTGGGEGLGGECFRL